jgi:glyoxylase-like metal-dependent hydrolase (beta-lactamase superfamily II)
MVILKQIIKLQSEMKKSMVIAALFMLTAACTKAQINTRMDTVVAAPVPYSAYGPQFDWNKGYYVAEVKKGTGVYWVTEGSHQLMFVTTGKGVVVVDAPPIFGDKIAKAIAEVTNEPVTHLIYSHYHADHIAGAYQFPKGIQIISSEGVKLKLKELLTMKRDVAFGTFVGGKPVDLPTKTFKGALTLVVGSKTLKLSTVKAAHTHGDVVVYLPKEKILNAVDFVWAGWVPFDGLGEAEDVYGYMDAQNQLLKQDWDIMVSGHVGRLATRQDIETNIAYMTDVKYAVMKALQNTDYMSAAKKTGFSNAFLTVETYFDMIAKTAASEVQAKWVGKLAGADVWTYSNCRRMMMWLRLN